MADAELLRTPSLDEWRLLDHLVGRAPQLHLPAAWRGAIRVQSLADGGMGSLRIVSADAQQPGRRFAARVAECRFTDQDNVDVIVSLNVDQEGTLFELDIWKTNFGQLLRVPEQLESGT